MNHSHTHTHTYRHTQHIYTHWDNINKGGHAYNMFALIWIICTVKNKQYESKEKTNTWIHGVCVMFELLIIARGFCIVIKINMNSSKCSCICTWVALCPSFCWLFFLSLVAYLFNNFPLSFFLFLFLSFSLCLINIIIIFHTFSRLFTLFFWVCSTLWWMSHVPEVVFWFWFVFFVFWDLFRVVAQQKQHTYTYSTSALNE